MGADRGVLIETDRSQDSISTALALAAAIQSDGRPWIILTGKESIDSEGMQTQFRLAHNLGLPVATNVVKVDITGDDVTVECEREAGTIDVIRMTTPCVIGAGKGLNTPNYPTFPDIVKSRKKPVRKISLAELAIEPPAAGMQVQELVPAVEQRTPKALTGSAADIAAKIVDILKNEAKVI
jgi:electron transfer flavoprotein beta subunit